MACTIINSGFIFKGIVNNMYFCTVYRLSMYMRSQFSVK